MIKFEELFNEGKATFNVNPVTQAFSVILWKDKLGTTVLNKTVTFELNNKNYELTKNIFDNNILNVTLDNNQITEEQLKRGIIKIHQ